MFTWYTASVGVVIVLVALRSYAIRQDALHPTVLMAPLFLYMYCAWPLILNRHGGLYQFFSPGGLEYVSLVYLVSVSSLYLGLSASERRGPVLVGLSIDIFNLDLDEPARRQISRLAWFLGALAVGAYVWKISNVGGLEEAYGHAKGGGSASSGYISESVLFSFPAVVLFAISRRPQKVGVADIMTALLMMLPHLLQGILGGRRGPIFLALSTLFVSWFIAKRLRPKMTTTIVGIGLCGLAVLFVWSQRQDVYLGSSGSVQVGRVWEKIVPEESVSAGNTYVVGAATVLMSDRLDFTYWGYRYFVTFFIRPIPKQVWPTKYEDMGADWLLDYGENIREQRYYNSVGFVPLSGSAYGYVADVFLEFSWGAVVFSYLLGRLFTAAWARHTSRGHFWSVLYILMVVLSIYLVTQSVTAWAYRVLFIGGLTYVFWRYFMKGGGGIIQMVERESRPPR